MCLAAMAGVTLAWGVAGPCVIVHPETGRRANRSRSRATNGAKRAGKGRYGMRSARLREPRDMGETSAAIVLASIARTASHNAFTHCRESRGAAYTG